MKRLRTVKWGLLVSVLAVLGMSSAAFASYADANELELVIDVFDGNVFIVGNDANDIAGFEFKSPGAQIQDGNYAPTGLFLVHMTATQTCSEFNLMGGSYVDGQYPLGTIWGGGTNWTFSYNFVGKTVPPQSQDDVTYIPEPATMSLLAVGGLAALLRRRR